MLDIMLAAKLGGQGRVGPTMATHGPLGLIWPLLALLGGANPGGHLEADVGFGNFGCWMQHGH